MKYVLLLVFAGLIFGLCFLADKGISAILRRARNRDRVMPPVRYPVMAAILTLVAVVSAVYGISHAGAVYVVAGAAFLAVAVWAVIYYRTTGIVYDEERFTFRRGSLRQTYRFSQIKGQRADVTRKIKCLVLCMEDADVVIYSNMQGYTPFLTQAYRSWCEAKGLNPGEQDWHDPADTRWFPDEKPEDETGEET